MKAEEEEKKNETQTRNKKKKLEKKSTYKKDRKTSEGRVKTGEKKKNCLKKGNIRFAWQTVRSCAVSGFNREV